MALSAELKKEYKLVADLITLERMQLSRYDVAHTGRSIHHLVSATPEGAGPTAYGGPYWRALAPSICSRMLAEWTLQNQREFTGRRVIDLGAGSGIASVAAAMGGAREATAVDVEGQGVVGINALINHVGDRVQPVKGNIFSPETQALINRADVITLCNFYTMDDGDIQPILLRRAREGATVIVSTTPDGDMGWDRLINHAQPICPKNRQKGMGVAGIRMFKVNPSGVA